MIEKTIKFLREVGKGNELFDETPSFSYFSWIIFQIQKPNNWIPWETEKVTEINAP